MEEKTITVGGAIQEVLEHCLNLPTKNKEWEEIKASMTIEKARLIKLMRQCRECTWRRVAEDCNFIFHGINEHGDQNTGRLLCAAAAEFLKEDWD